MIVRVMVLVPRNSIDKKRFIGQSVANHDLFFFIGQVIHC